LWRWHHFPLPLIPCRADAEEYLFVFEQNGQVRGRDRFDNFSSLRSRNVRRQNPVSNPPNGDKKIDVSKKGDCDDS
jgi:hypothetical protein